MPLLANPLPKGPYFGIVAQFGTPADLFHACERVRDAGFTRWDAHTPFPVHGLEGAMGIRRSFLPWVVLTAGLSTVRLAPALVVTNRQVDIAVDILDAVLATMAS